MKWWIVLVVIWALGCVRMYIIHADKIDKMKEEDKKTPPILYDIVGVGILLCWPLMVPTIIKKAIRITKEKKKK